jgi:hypothetical protein
MAARLVRIASVVATVGIVLTNTVFDTKNNPKKVLASLP